MDKYLLQKYEIYHYQMCFVKFQMHQNTFSACPGPLWGSFWRSPRFLFGWGERLKQGKYVLDFS